MAGHGRASIKGGSRHRPLKCTASFVRETSYEESSTATFLILGTQLDPSHGVRDSIRWKRMHRGAWQGSWGRSG